MTKVIEIDNLNDLLDHKNMDPYNTKYVYVFDLDGTLVINRKNIIDVIKYKNEHKIPKRLMDNSIPFVKMYDSKVYYLTDSSVVKTVQSLYNLGHKIYICTCRKETKRKYIVEILSRLGIVYHKLICTGRLTTKGKTIQKMCGNLKEKVIIVDDVTDNLDSFDEIENLKIIKIKYYPCRFKK